MSQLIKHRLVDRDTGEWILGSLRGYVFPKIKGLEIIHQLTDENGVNFCLSTAPDYFEYSVIVSLDILTEYQSNPNITIVSSAERQIEVPVVNPETLESTGETTTETVYDVTYQEAHILQEDEGLQILTQEEWDAEIVSFDARQEQKRLTVLRSHRDTLLRDTDWIVIKCTETGVGLCTDFKVWRQTLRDLPSIASTSFPSSLPIPPENVSVLQNTYDTYSSQVLSIFMINDPLVGIGTTL